MNKKKKFQGYEYKVLWIGCLILFIIFVYPVILDNSFKTDINVQSFVFGLSQILTTVFVIIFTVPPAILLMFSAAPLREIELKKIFNEWTMAYMFLFIFSILFPLFALLIDREYSLSSGSVIHSPLLRFMQNNYLKISYSLFILCLILLMPYLIQLVRQNSVKSRIDYVINLIRKNVDKNNAEEVMEEASYLSEIIILYEKECHFKIIKGVIKEMDKILTTSLKNNKDKTIPEILYDGLIKISKEVKTTPLITFALENLYYIGEKILEMKNLTNEDINKLMKDMLDAIGDISIQKIGTKQEENMRKAAHIIKNLCLVGMKKEKELEYFIFPKAIKKLWEISINLSYDNATDDIIFCLGNIGDEFITNNCSEKVGVEIVFEILTSLQNIAEECAKKRAENHCLRALNRIYSIAEESYRTNEEIFKDSIIKNWIIYAHLVKYIPESKSKVIDWIEEDNKRFKGKYAELVDECIKYLDKEEDSIKKHIFTEFVDAHFPEWIFRSGTGKKALFT